MTIVLTGVEPITFYQRTASVCLRETNVTRKDQYLTMAPGVAYLSDLSHTHGERPIGITCRLGRKLAIVRLRKYLLSFCIGREESRTPCGAISDGGRDRLGKGRPTGMPMPRQFEGGTWAWRLRERRRRRTGVSPPSSIRWKPLS